MTSWTPLTKGDIELRLAREIAELAPGHRARFTAIAVPLRAVAVLDSPGESVFVVAEHADRIIYWSDIEEGWECEAPNGSGGIDHRGCNQFKLSHVAHQLFGEADAK
jgi:hypothetical protein